MTIEEFIEARLVEDEEIARAATAGNWEWTDLGLNVHGDWTRCPHYCDFPPTSTISRGTPKMPGHEHRFTTAVVVSASGYDDPSVDVSDADAAHIVRHDPARVLRQCAMIRAMLKHAEDAGGFEFDADGEFYSGIRNYDAAPTIHTLMDRDIAAVWSNHPDYQPEWAPKA